MANLYSFIPSLILNFPQLNFDVSPWLHVSDVENMYANKPPISNLNEFTQQGNIWIHPTASIEQNVMIKGFAVISENCFIAANAYLRGGVILGPHTTVGPSTELKSVICSGHSAFAHLNYIGNSLIGSNVNFEAGSIAANHLNESVGTTIKVRVEDKVIDTGQLKFGAFVGDSCNIGANSVLSPGTILSQNTNVPRLTLVQQISE